MGIEEDNEFIFSDIFSENISLNNEGVITEIKGILDEQDVSGRGEYDDVAIFEIVLSIEKKYIQYANIDSTVVRIKNRNYKIKSIIRNNAGYCKLELAELN